MPYEPIPLDYERPAAEEQLARSRDFVELMRSRRSVREFSRESVPVELIENAIAVAGRAPCGANQQPWTFVVVSDPDLKRRIRAAAEEEERISYERRMPVEWLEALEPLGTDWRSPTSRARALPDRRLRAGIRPLGRPQAEALLREEVGRHRRRLPAGGAPSFGFGRAHAHALADGLPRPGARPAAERAGLLPDPVGYPAEGATVPAITMKPLEEILVRA